MMKKINLPSPNTWTELCKRPAISLKTMDGIVQEIFDAVQASGDEAIALYAEKFNEYAGKDLLVSIQEIEAAALQIDEDLKAAINVAYKNIYAFHSLQKTTAITLDTMDGITCSKKSVPIRSVGLYIPGGTAPLFSTVLMLGVPAQIAGCANVQICTPVNTEGIVHPAILYTAQLCGIKNIFKVGGIQAVAAMSIGTNTIKKSDKIFGPGNQYVAAAKQKAIEYGVAADLPAGPSEVLVIADDHANPSFVAADLLAQAEHGKDSQVVVLSTSQKLLEEVNEQLKIQLELLPRKEICEASLENSLSILFNDLDSCIAFSNEYAPEHLILQTQEDEKLADKVTNAGSVFIGKYTAESMGDYASGTNHTLPTAGFANSFSGVSVGSFEKQITFQKATEQGLINIGKYVEIMAATEGLDAHKNAISTRLASLKN